MFGKFVRSIDYCQVLIHRVTIRKLEFLRTLRVRTNEMYAFYLTY